jgi:chorismate mutase
VVKAIRGATVAAGNSKNAIIKGTAELLEEIINKNGLSSDQIISIIFTSTDDLTAEFPAVAARQIGLTDVPLLCCKELSVKGSLKRCIRLMMHVNLSEVSHVYLGEAKKLRDDL